MNVTVVLGNQLFQEYLTFPTPHRFLMIESRFFTDHFRFHQHKLVLVFSSMRQFAAALRDAGHVVDYIKIESTEQREKSYFDLLEEFLKKGGIKSIRIAEISDRAFEKQFIHWGSAKNIKIEWLPNGLFLTPRDLVREKLLDGRPFMKDFYVWQRKRLKILIEQDGSPTGGQWSFDSENRKKLPKSYRAPIIQSVQPNQFVSEVMEIVQSNFAHHPGDAKSFWLPTSHSQALEWFRLFLKDRFKNFGPYEDAISSIQSPDHDILNHSALSPLMNIGLLPPKTILTETLKFARLNSIPIASVEGFVRQIIGWREFVKGIDTVFGEKMESSNFFNHHRTLKPVWYSGTTGLPPVDDAIKKANRRGYNHHIERLMILSNVMLLCQVSPKEVFRWFMEMYVDSYEWVMSPNVYGMGQFSDGGIFATKPYICGSNYILKMSDYKRGDWCDIWDALYWNFIEQNLEFFKKCPRLSMMAKILEKMPSSKKIKFREVARAFRERVTSPSLAQNQMTE